MSVKFRRFQRRFFFSIKLLSFEILLCLIQHRVPKPAFRHCRGGPDLNRPREALEAFPLDSLQMVGTIERDGIFFALLKNTSDNIYRVSVGNYVGQNSGKIEKINAIEIGIKEWLSNGKGGWREHVLTIPLRSKSSVTKGA